MDASLKNIFISFAIIISFCMGYFLKSGDNIIIKEKEIVIKEIPKEVTKEVFINNQKVIGEAKSYYEKAFKLFLVNIGYSLTDRQKTELQEVIAEPAEYLAKKNNQNPILREFDFTPTESFNKLVAKEEADLKSITDESLLKNAQKFILKDPALFFVRSKLIITFDSIKKINGEYRAQLFRLVGKNKGRIDNIYLQADYILKDEDKIDGNFNLKLSHEGKVYSDSNGSGGNGNIRIKNGDLIIKAGPSYYFHFKGMNLNEANFYTGGKFVGMARFQKI